MVQNIRCFYIFDCFYYYGWVNKMALIFKADVKEGVLCLFYSLAVLLFPQSKKKSF